MPRVGDMPAALPLFPLPGAVLMPRARLPLQIFEPRYLQMFDDALKSGHRLIGMIQPIGDGLARVGTAGRISAFSEMDGGRMMVSLKAVSRFHLGEVEEGFAPYLRGRADWSGFSADLSAACECDPRFDRESFLLRLERYLKVRELLTDWHVTDEAEDEMLINALAMLLPLEVEEKQALLESSTLPARRELLDGLIEFALHGGAREETLQ